MNSLKVLLLINYTYMVINICMVINYLLPCICTAHHIPKTQLVRTEVSFGEVDVKIKT